MYSTPKNRVRALLENVFQVEQKSDVRNARLGAAFPLNGFQKRSQAECNPMFKVWEIKIASKKIDKKVMRI